MEKEEKKFERVDIKEVREKIYSLLLTEYNIPRRQFNAETLLDQLGPLSYFKIKIEKIFGIMIKDDEWEKIITIENLLMKVEEYYSVKKIYDHIFTILTIYCKCDPEKVRPESNQETLGLEFLEYANFICLVETHFGVRLKNSELGEIRNLKNLAYKLNGIVD